MTKKKYPEGHFTGMWMGIGIAIFTGVGVPLSISTGNYAFFGIGPALGVAFGLAVGKSIEDKHKKKGLIRPLTPKERKRKHMGIWAGVIFLVLGVLAFLLMQLR
ncbi:hypothetical protein ACFLZB_00415 [Nanoarchaeota archaeon]